MMSKKRFTSAQWRIWFEEFDRSGLTVGQFCHFKDTTPNTFYNWRRKLRGDQSPLRINSSTQPQEEGTAGVFVSVVPPAAVDGQVEFVLPGGAKVHVDNDRDSLRPILEVLLELGGRA